MDIWRIQQQVLDAGFGYEDPDGILGRATFAGIFSYVADRHLGDRGMGLGDGCANSLPSAHIGTTCRLAYFLAETAANTNGYRDLEENLRYSEKALKQIWPHFANHHDVAYPMNPREIALEIYSGHMGNGRRDTNDGWRYRARGLIPIIGRTAYARWGEETGLPLITTPELAADPEIAVKIACAVWASFDLNAAADLDNPTLFCQATGSINAAMPPTTFIRYLKRARTLFS